MRQISVAVIGTGWCGGIRAETLAKHPLVKSLHLAEIRAERLDELKRKLNPASLMQEVKLVPNGWIALGRYQQQGYAYIAP